MSILSNPWFIGIGGGIVSGLLTALISRWIFSRRDNREYLQKTKLAHREILYAIRPGISEGDIPARETIEALVSATARKYAIDVKDLPGPHDLGQDLLKEVMDSSFISSKAKAEYCRHLGPLLQPPSQQAVKHPSATASPEAISEYRRRTYTTLSMMMGLFATLLTTTVAFIGRSTSAFEVLTPTIVALAGVLAATYFLFMMRAMERRRETRAAAERETPPRPGTEKDGH
jgi:hypothetical protein